MRFVATCRRPREIADRTEGRARQAIEFEDKTLANAFERMTTEELEAYARDGTLPPWFPRTKVKEPTVVVEAQQTNDVQRI